MTKADKIYLQQQKTYIKTVQLCIENCEESIRHEKKQAEIGRKRIAMDQQRLVYHKQQIAEAKAVMKTIK